MTGSELININTHYQLASYGLPIRILCIDAPGTFPVIGIDDSGAVHKWDRHGLHPIDADYNLIQRDFEIDEPILYRCSSSNEQWLNGYFAGKNASGEFCVWLNGATSWTTKCRIHVPFIRRPTLSDYNEALC